MTRTQSALIVDAGSPTPENDAGSVAVGYLEWGLAELGFQTRLAAEARPRDLQEALARNYDVVVLSRPSTYLRNHSLINREKTKVLYFAHDLHFVRLSLGQALGENSGSLGPRVMKSVEAFCFSSADLVLLPTEEEVAVVHETWPDVSARRINYFAMEPVDERPSFASSHGLVFIGSREHAPNRDGLAWFFEEVWPGVVGEAPDITLTLIGDWASDFEQVHNVRVLGNVSDSEVDVAMSAARIGIAPLRYGAGMKRKTLHYFAAGLPVVSTDFGLEGIRATHVPEPAAVIARSSDEWVARLLELHAQESRWNELSRNAKRHVSACFSNEAYLSDLSVALQDALQ